MAGHENVINALILAFFINAPIQIIMTVAQWLVMARIIGPKDKTARDALRCLVLSYITAYILAVLIWLVWPLEPELILYRDRISIPAIIGELIAIPFWLKRFGYFKKQTFDENP